MLDDASTHGMPLVAVVDGPRVSDPATRAPLEALPEEARDAFVTAFTASLSRFVQGALSPA